MHNVKLIVTVASIACLSLIGFAMSEHDYKNNPEYWRFKATLAHKYKNLDRADGLSQELWNESLIRFMQHKALMLLPAGNEIITIIDRNRKDERKFYAWTINLRENRLIHSGPLAVYDYRQSALKLKNTQLFQLSDRLPAAQSSLLKLAPLASDKQTLAETEQDEKVFHKVGGAHSDNTETAVLNVTMSGVSPRSEWPEQAFYFVRPLVEASKSSAAEELALEYYMCRGQAY